MVPEDMMNDFLFNLNEITYDMIVSIKLENYEDAALYRDFINKSIKSVKKKLLKDNLTALSEGELDILFWSLKVQYIKEWSVELQLDNEKVPIDID